ncbi:alpha/beta fold hydrolase [Parashewanella spongiae]|uniref:Alpha/beta fold hydrolase n=1 Tax=Parashewanella spongiae TaxID=342950 RepID=A0A3A6UG52_9GAMM|nr:alpha/beta fold hydrolase [Parashewanella spongiae]MCL1077984.1 alpha/beta fold hydrolase [Parashewanella spongiae]RJY16421.1 alpha/beta fold hydrolase [Parashewanella spongiae]
MEQQDRVMYSSEHALNTIEQLTFWRSVEHSQLQVSSDVTLAYCRVLHPYSDKAIVISNGRIESYEKYQELIFDLYQQGYSVYALDHRGQGKSTRLVDNPQLGHVDKFQDYVTDFSSFISQVVQADNHQQLFLLGHSMGCTVATLYLEHYPNVFDAAIFSAPMYGICLPLPRFFILWLAKRLDFTNQGKPFYVIGGRNYYPKPFENNSLTQSQPRYQWFRNLYQQFPQLQLGSPTHRWLVEALIAAKQCQSILASTTTPVLILQAKADTIVDNRAQDKCFAAMQQNSNQHQKVVFSDARHELFVENDTIRNQVLDSTFDFINRHSHQD